MIAFLAARALSHCPARRPNITASLGTKYRATVPESVRDQKKKERFSIVFSVIFRIFESANIFIRSRPLVEVCAPKVSRGDVRLLLTGRSCAQSCSVKGLWPGGHELRPLRSCRVDAPSGRPFTSQFGARRESLSYNQNKTKFHEISKIFNFLC